MKRIISVLLASVFVLLLSSCQTDVDTTPISSVTAQANSNTDNSIITVDFDNDASFEAALNNGEKVKGKVVRFYVESYHPDSGLGINCWSGEHLNFISKEEPGVAEGDYVIGRITKEASKTVAMFGYMDTMQPFSVKLCAIRFTFAQ